MDPQRVFVALTDPSVVGVPLSAVWDARSLPYLIEPATSQAWFCDNQEPLQRVDGPGVSVHPALFRDGIADASQHVLARTGVATRLRQASATLTGGFSLTVLDGWRSPDLQRSLHLAGRGEQADLAPQRTGGSVDVTLSWFGVPLALGTGYTEVSEGLATEHFEARSGQYMCQMRRVLVNAMRSAGFVVHKDVWFRFEYGTLRWAAITGQQPLYLPTSL